MPNQNDIRQAITNQIIAALESGSVPPWRRPWRLGKNAGAPANVVSKRSYRGLNPILLALHAEKHQLTSKWYGTFNQWKALGGRVMRRPDNVPQGQWGCQICFWTPVTKTVHTEEGDREEDRFFVLRMYTVFCVDQVEGKNLDHLRAGQPDTGEPLTVDYQPAEDAIAATGASIRYGGGKAFYSPSGDYIQVPPKATFESLDEFYAHVLPRTVPLERARVPAELEPQGEGEHVRPWRTRRRDRFLLLVQGTGRACLGEPRKPHRLRRNLAQGDA